jgi:hypothetical protein
MEKKVQGSHNGLISDIFVNGLLKTTKNCQDTRPLGFNSGPFEEEAVPNGRYSSENSTVDGFYMGE